MPVLQSPLCRLLKVALPIDQAPMGWAATPALVRARLATLKTSLVLRRLGALTEGD